VTIHVHEFGVRHLVDPSRLVASARRLYGDELDQRWGIIEPAPAERVRAVYDGDVLRFGDVTLTAIETPGHARHHHAWQLETDEGPVCFTGDAAACSMAESEFISFPTPPPEFDREAWHETLDRLEREHFVALYPTHFGRVDDPPHHLQLVRAEMEAQVALIAGLVEAGADELTIYENHRDAVAAKAAQLGVPESKRHFYAGESHAQRNVAGVLRYLRKKAEAEQVAAAATNGERV
jgi:glyoxylase-like metal-dependent hydrolase (beta-lactamase superfamily II)